MRRREKGFSLIELMISVVIVTIIASIAYPMFSKNSAKARRTQAISALEAARLANENFRSRNGTYLAGGESPNLLPGYDPGEWFGVDPGSVYTIEIESGDQNNFVITATCRPPDCNIDDDNTADIVAIDARGKFDIRYNDIEN